MVTWAQALGLLSRLSRSRCPGGQHDLGFVQPGATARCACGRVRGVGDQHGGVELRSWRLPDGHSMSWSSPVMLNVFPSEELWETLVDLARAGREQEFRDLAAMVGVEPSSINGLWRGTIKRLHRSGAKP